MNRPLAPSRRDFTRAARRELDQILRIDDHATDVDVAAAGVSRGRVVVEPTPGGDNPRPGRQVMLMTGVFVAPTTTNVVLRL
jgi:hypothetical protein